MTDAFDHELERRLSEIESPDYVDPARHDLPALDLWLLAVGSAVVVGVMLWWGAPV